MSPPLLASLLLLALGTRAPAPPAPQAAADEQYRFLAGLVDKGLHELAVGEAQAFLRAYPRHEKAALVRYRLANALWELARRDEAAREYDALARLEGFEYRAECLFRCGEAALARGDETRAQAAFEGVLTSAQDYLLAPALFALAEGQFRARRFELAEPRYQELLRTHPQCAEAPLARRALVWCAFERGDRAATVQRARDFLGDERDPARRDELQLLLGEALLASDPRAALEAFRALSTAEQAEARLRGEGFALAALGDDAGAARAFEALLERAPEGPLAREAALQAGIARLRTGDAAAGVRRLEAAAKSGEAETIYWLARAQRENGDISAALATLARALRAQPGVELASRIQVLRGDCLAADGRAAEALSAYEQSGSTTALHAGALAALEQGDADGAVRLAERLLRAEPGPEPAQAARVILGEAHFLAGRYDEAERAFEQAEARPADGAEAVRLASRLAWCRYLAGDLGTARTRFAQLVERHGDAPDGAPEVEEALALLVRIAAEEGPAEAARAPAMRYLERYPRGSHADRALLALARAATGADARRGLEQWLQRFPEHPERVAVELELAELELAAGAHANAARRYARVRELAPGSSAAARATYGQAWCAFERHDLAACREALAPLLAPAQPAASPREGAKAAQAAQNAAARAEAAEPTPELRRAALELGLWVEVEDGRLEQAVDAWRALVAQGGDEDRRLAGARRILAALRAAQRFDAAEALLGECLSSLTTPALAAEAWLEGTYLALERGDPQAAEASLGRAQRTGADPARLAEAGFHVGEARLAAGDEARALSLFADAATESSPRAADALYKLAFVQLGRGELELAEAALTRLLAGHPTSALAPEASFLRAECAFRRGDFERAATGFADLARRAEAGALAGSELRARALFRAGLAWGELARWSECATALAELARVSPQFPNLAEAELWRGRALAAQDQGRAARAAFERTLALDQGLLAAGARLALGHLHEREGRLDDALSEYLKVALLFAHEEAVAEALLGAGRVLEAQGSDEQAAARYRELVDEHGASPFAEQARERLRARAAREPARRR